MNLANNLNLISYKWGNFKVYILTLLIDLLKLQIKFKSINYLITHLKLNHKADLLLVIGQYF